MTKDKKRRISLDQFKFNFWVFLWETFEFLYRVTGLRWQRPIEFFKPDLCVFMWEKITKMEGHEIKDNDGNS